MKSIEKTAYGKINLGLDVIGRRNDGYHLLRMIMQSVGISDSLTFKQTSSAEIDIVSNLRYLPTGPKNLIYRAIDLVRAEYGIKDGVSVRVEKGIPVAAGMAGGSSDAAAGIIAMNGLFDLGMSPERMCELGMRLGADIPFCLHGGICLAEGIGEKLTSLPEMPQCHIVLIKPQFGISTKHVYQEIDNKVIEKHPDIDAIEKGLKKGDLRQICDNLGNALELVSLEEYPVLREIKDMLRAQGASGVLMSGSGPSVFGIFDDLETARKAFGFFMDSEYKNGTFLTEPVKSGTGIGTCP